MQVPGAPPQLEKPQAPPIPPVYIAMAAAQMHAEGRWPQPEVKPNGPNSNRR